MADKRIALLIVADQEYTRHVGKDEKKYASQMNALYSSISNVYLPLLNMASTFQEESVHFRVSLVLSPIVCSLLSDHDVQNQYVAHLEKKISLAKKELSKVQKNPALVNCITSYLERLDKNKTDFVSVYKKNLIGAFASFQKNGYIELLGTCATPIFAPHYMDMNEVLNAQVEVGLYSHRVYFGCNPQGFYIPEMAYAKGIEKVLRSYGISYTVLDARSVLFSEPTPAKGIFSPYQIGNNIVAFAQDNRIENELHSFATNEVYCNLLKDISFELPYDELLPYIEKGFPRYPSGLCYWNNLEKESDASVKTKFIYNHKDALAQCKLDANAFVKNKIELLESASSLFKDGDAPVLVCKIDAISLANTWAESFNFIEEMFRCESQNVFATFSEVFDSKASYPFLLPYYSSATETGYSETFLTNKNNFMLRYIRKASSRIQDLAERFPDDTGLKERLLNLGAKEFLLAQSSLLSKMIGENDFPEYAMECFKERVLAFSEVFNSLGSNTVSTEWLCDLENRHTIFPWLNYRVFCKKH
ncbi:MAG: DUF1957 domain-containing protein [Treponema sp.]|nr:DUF1957 domain-containing protein [Treponema sp.]